jgi:hypothetical protein
VYGLSHLIFQEPCKPEIQEKTNLEFHPKPLT